MWYQSPKENEITVPPNLIKNLNVYDDILEPQKNGASSAEHMVDKLIDIDDCSKDSGFQDCNINASFLDMNKELDLIDLYQNMFVTPQHIKKKETTTDSVDNATSLPLNIDFKNFFDTLESGKKIDWSKANFNEESIPTDCDKEKPRVLIPKVFLESEPDSDPEDIIYEVLTQKNMEKLHMSNTRNQKVQANINTATTNNIKKSEEVTDFSKFNLNNSVSEDSKFDSKSNRKGCVLDTKPSPVTTQTNDLNNFTLEAMKKDEKIYKKKRIVKPVSQTNFFTKGPDFNEKSVVLPQIMARMFARKAYLDERNNHKKRLLLDSGATPKTENFTRVETTKKETNNSSFNPEKLKKLDKEKDPKLCMNQLSQSIAVHSTVNACPNCNKTAKKSNSSSGLPIGMVNDTVKLSSAQKSTMTPKTLTVTDSVKLMAAKKPAVTPKILTVADSVKLMAAKKPTVTLKPVTVADNVKLSPIVLMEDCNRERLKALKQSQMFKNFVYNGKFEP